MNQVLLDDEPIPMIERVYQYIQDNAHCSRTEIVKALGIGGGTASTCLTRLRELGEIKRNRTDIINAAGITWEVGAEDGFDEIDKRLGAPMRTIVTSWAPHMRRDSLVEMLFGKAF